LLKGPLVPWGLKPVAPLYKCLLEGPICSQN
jgi:hypothetical protein